MMNNDVSCLQSTNSYSNKNYRKFCITIGAIILCYGVKIAPYSQNQILNNNFNSSYISYSNYNLRGFSKVVDLNKKINLSKIEQMSKLKKNWNGYNSLPFSSGALFVFRKIINSLKHQPEIAPTGRNTLYAEFRLKDNSLLAFEIGENKAEKVIVKQGNYDSVYKEVIESDLINKVIESVDKFYE